MNDCSQDKGVSSYVCVFSLKNPSFPEYLCAANSGVMCVDIHSKHPHMLAAGLADGTVAVYNMQEILNYLNQQIQFINLYRKSDIAL